VDRGKIRSVIRHEYFTVIKQPGFILSMVGIPMLLLVIFGISFLADKSVETNIEEMSGDIDNVLVLDQSGIIEPDVVELAGYELTTKTRAEVIESVKSQEASSALIYPEDLVTTREFEIFMDGGDDFVASSALTAIGEQIVKTSLLARFEDQSLGELLVFGAVSTVTVYESGVETAGVGQYIVPGFIMASFFVVLFFSMSYMLLSVAEEKENRSMEMVLTYMRPKTLITGKLLSIGLVGLTQLLFFMVVGAVSYWVMTTFEWVNLPFEIDLSNIVFDPVAIVGGLLVLLFGFLFYAAIMSGVASVMPSVKEANSLSGVFYLFAFAPLYAGGILMSAPDNIVVRVLSFLPLTSPSTLLFRNAYGNISALELFLAIAVLIIGTFLAFKLAAKLFRLGALEFNDRVKISSIFR
jgi:ABC-2 type transport system permease protein